MNRIGDKITIYDTDYNEVPAIIVGHVPVAGYPGDTLEHFVMVDEDMELITSPEDDDQKIDESIDIFHTHTDFHNAIYDKSLVDANKSFVWISEMAIVHIIQENDLKYI